MRDSEKNTDCVEREHPFTVFDRSSSFEAEFSCRFSMVFSVRLKKENPDAS